MHHFVRNEIIGRIKRSVSAVGIDEYASLNPPYLVKKLLLYWQTLKHLKFSQIYWRLFYRFVKQKLPTKILLPVQSSVKPWQNYVLYKASIKLGNNQQITITLLHQKFSLGFFALNNNSQLSALAKYHLHYFNDLAAEDFHTRFNLQIIMIKKWLAEIPTASKPAWDAYPTSLRIVNWIKWYWNTQALNLWNDLPNIITFEDDFLTSLAQQAQWLSQHCEYHLLGNHLFENAKALVFAGLFFNAPQALQWYQQGMAILARQIPEQILSDGGHFERSPMYHAIILQGLLDLYQILQKFNYTCPNSWAAAITQMLCWLKLMLHQDNKIAFFNDSTFDEGATYDELATYARALGIEVNHNTFNSIYLASSGFARLQNHDLTVLVDCGSIKPDYLPGHAHAESLCFELSFAGKRWLVNSGINTYEISSSRLEQRGTAAHNSIVIDGSNSSNIWSSFRVANRARVKINTWQIAASQTLLNAKHDGYRGKNITHERSWLLTDSHLQLIDILKGQGSHDIAWYLHIAPGIIATLERNILVLTDNISWIKISLSDQLHYELQSSEFYPGFNLNEKNQTLIGKGRLCLPVNFEFNVTYNNRVD